MTKFILKLLLIAVSSISLVHAAPVKLPGNIAVHIAKRHYLHPVRLLDPYMDVWFMKGPTAEKAAMEALQTRFANISECADDSKADVVLLLEPHLFYNPQTKVFHTEYIARAYTDDGKPITRIKEQAQQLGNLNITSDFYIEKSYRKAIDKVIEKLVTDQAFLATLDKNTGIDAGSLCHKLDYLPLDKFYY